MQQEVLCTGNDLFHCKKAKGINAEIRDHCRVTDERSLVVHEGAVDRPHRGHHVGHGGQEEAWRPVHRAPHVSGFKSFVQYKPLVMLRFVREESDLI